MSLQSLRLTKEGIAKLVRLEMGASNIAGVIETTGLNSMVVPIKFTASRELRSGVPRTYELNEKTDRQRCQNPVPPNHLRPGPRLAVSASFLRDPILSQDAEAPQAWSAGRR